MNHEKSLLAGLLLFPEYLDTYQLNPVVFFEPKNEKVFRAMQEMNADRELINMVSLAAKIPALQDYVFELSFESVPSASIAYFADKVSHDYTKRRLKEIGQTIATSDAEPEELIDSALSMLSNLTAGKSSTRSLFEIYQEVMQQVKEPPKLIDTGFTDLNKCLHGYRRGGMYVVAARPGVGKTIFALETAFRLAEKGGVLFFSMEMDDTELVKRLISSVSSVLASDLATSNLSEQDFERVNRREGSFKRELHINHQSAVNVNYIRSEFRQLNRRTPIKAIVIDYLGLMSDVKKGKGRYEIVTNISNDLKQLARELQVPIIALHQLNREVENRAGSRPGLSDLRDSGAIEQDADAVILLHRELVNGIYENILHAGVAKNRHGAQATMQFVMHPAYVRIDHD